MNTSEIVNVITTPLFWGLTVAGSVALSIIGNLLTPKVASLIDQKRFSRKKQLTRKREKLFGEVIIRFDDTDKVINSKLDSMHAFILACAFMLLALLLFTISTALEWLFIPIVVRIVISIAGITVLSLSIYLIKHGMKRMDIVRLAEERTKIQSVAQSQGLEPEKVIAALNEWDVENFGITMEELGRILNERIQAEQGAASDR